MSNIDIGDIFKHILIYIVVIVIAQWICGKLFYDVDMIPQLIYTGKWIKGVILLIILFFIYFMAAETLTENREGKIAAIIIFVILGFGIVDDLGEVYSTAKGIERVPLFIGILLYNGMDVLKLIAMYLAFKN